ncbi:MAG: SMU1112c/YaeR family gloxylase I-like metalloprotein [Endozoicomonas sp.]
MKIKNLHHIAVICSDYQASRQFYTDILGLEVIDETWREEKQSWKLDLALNGQYLIELFSFPAPPARPTRPEATGARHIAFAVDDINVSVKALQEKGVTVESVRTDPVTGLKFTFFQDPDGLPLELYEA